MIARDLLRLRPVGPTSPQPIPIQGSKNVFNHLAAVSVIGRDIQLMLQNSPGVTDRRTVLQILRSTGLSTHVGSVVVVGGRPSVPQLDALAGSRIRASICYAAGLASNLGRSVAPIPGGDAFTHRPIDLHLRVLEAAGATCSISSRTISIAFGREPQAIDVSLRTSFGPSMGATVTALLVAARANGMSVLRDASVEPEVAATIALLRAFGIEIVLEGEGCLRVFGGGGPLSGSVLSHVPPDRIEAGTYLLAGLLLHRMVVLEGIALDDFPRGFLDTLVRIGIRIIAARGRVQATLTDAANAVAVRTAPHPGYPTDLQPQLCAFLTQIHGLSFIDEQVYDSRSTHVRELAKLGLRVEIDGSRQWIHGPQTITGGRADITDIRCGAALIVAAAAAQRPTELVDGGGHLARAYGLLDQKLERLGFQVERQSA